MFTLYYSSPQCYMPSFVETGPPVPEKKIFEGVLPYMDMTAILVMTLVLFTNTFYRCFISLLAFIGQVGFKEEDL